MKTRRAAIAVGAMLGLLAGTAAADPQVDLGRQEFKAKCAACHGASGKGDGPQAAALPKKVPDLTTYAKRNGGTLPEKQAWIMIDGRMLDDRTQSSRPMPTWGHTFQQQARADEVKDLEPYVKQRIDAVVAYLKTIQAK